MYYLISLALQYNEDIVYPQTIELGFVLNVSRLLSLLRTFDLSSGQNTLSVGGWQCRHVLSGQRFGE